MEWATEKWGGRPHYRGVVEVLGEDEHGTWLWGPVGRTIYRGEEALFVSTHAALVVIEDGAWWAPTWWVGHPEVETYINIGTPPVWSAEGVVSTDLDLDVIRFLDGRVEV